MTQSSKFFVAIVTAVALVALAASVVGSPWGHLPAFAMMLVITLVASRFKVSLPGLEGNVSVNLPFLLIAAVQFGAGEAIVLALLSTLVQSISNPMSARKLTQMQFNCATIMLATAAAQFAARSANSLIPASSMAVVAASVAYLAVNVGLVGAVIGMSDKRPVLHTVGQVFTLTFPHFVLGAGVAHFLTSTASMSWTGATGALAVMILVYFSYRRVFAAQESKREQMQVLHTANAAD